MNVHRCWAEIDLAALRHNAEAARNCVGANVAMLAVIKANGYGHGLAAVASALGPHVQLFGVANSEEAIAARAAVPHPIIILGPALPEERARIVTHGFIPSISSYDEALEFSRLAAGSSVAIHCVIDTGMGRMGMAETDAIAELKRILTLPRTEIHSISTHLPVADEDPAYTRTQLSRFTKLAAGIRAALPGTHRFHVLPSAGILSFASSAFDIVRAGLMLYGASPFPQLQDRLQPALTLKSRIVLLRQVPAGTSISYGRTLITQRPTRVATVSVGYADGLPRRLSRCGAAVLIDGRRCPVLGRVTMDLTMVDVTELNNVALGDEVVLIGRQGGQQILASEMAAHASTIAWEVFTGIGSRVARVYV